MENVTYFHALKINKEKCFGCTHCMRVCPTSAIRIIDGKAQVNSARCIDCGECVKACPATAIEIIQDDFSKIFEYKYRVALIPSVLIGQFREEIYEQQIFSSLLEMGFTHVFEVGFGAEILQKAINNYMQEHPDIKPLISGFCPAIVRLIQVNFPSLVENIVPIKAPVDVAALYYKKHLIDSGIQESDIGLFYITPCAAKIVAVKSPVGEKKSVVDGIINMDFIFNKILKSVINTNKSDRCLLAEVDRLSDLGILWSLTGGESKWIKGRCLAVDGVKNAIQILEKIENEEITGIDFLEIRACDESCAGGVLTPNNRFLTVERLKKRANSVWNVISSKKIENYIDYLMENIKTEKILPRSILKLDEDMLAAMKKMENANKIIELLPRIDCGVCGSPSCMDLAEDIVRGEAKMTNCIFIQRQQELKIVNRLRKLQSVCEKIWGKQCNNINDNDIEEKNDESFRSDK